VAERSAAWRIDANGQLNVARRIDSPNSDERPAGVAPSLIVVHGISLPPNEFGGDYVAQLFTNRLDWNAHPYFRAIEGMRVSSHFFVRRDGEVIQFVSCAQRAWHAGASSWGGRERCNDFSVGIELEGADDIPYESAQYEALSRLCDALMRRYPTRDIVGHSDVAPGRKTDPGPSFDWPRFRALLHAVRSL